MYLRRKIFHLCIMALCLGTALPSVAYAAAAWPKSTIKVIVPFAAGAANDLVTRTIAPELSKILGVPVVVENVPGASGSIGLNRLAHAKPDGYTLAVAAQGSATVTANFNNVGYTTKEFAPICQIVNLDQSIYVSKAGSIKTLKELLDKAEKEQLAYAIPGIHAAPRLTVESLMHAVGKPKLMALVPFTGGSEVVAAVLSGKVAAGGSPLQDIVPYIKNGSLLVLAIAAPERDPDFPDIPTLKELGYPIELGTWFGLTAPAKTPP
ncbi:MAG: tripartite tricarboxylate transporter substrate binding protein, partial [Deltaproteobacteria bacterium]|nr:tripartite tricarboxylate transporter substrate binding protein [Deltaproteobacteria bacterium]